MSYDQEQASLESMDELDWYGWRREMKRLRAEVEAANVKLARVEAEIQNFIDVTPRERTPFDFLQRLRGVLTDYADLKRECGF